jgi:hypothetical protein
MGETVVFVVARDVGTRRQMTRVLSQALDAHVISMSGGAATVAWAHAAHPAAVVILPGAPGSAEWLLGGLLRERPETARTPLIAVIGPGFGPPVCADWTETVTEAEGHTGIADAVRRALNRRLAPPTGIRATAVGRPARWSRHPP